MFFSHTDIPTYQLHSIYSHIVHLHYIRWMHRVKVLFVSLWSYLLFFCLNPRGRSVHRVEGGAPGANKFAADGGPQEFHHFIMIFWNRYFGIFWTILGNFMGYVRDGTASGEIFGAIFGLWLQDAEGKMSAFRRKGGGMQKPIPSGNLTYSSHWKSPIIVDLLVRNYGFP